ncbi:hypothetical protein BC830DRAFT_86262 [Chytriomyces sp. MP71]|nr:hypothetical protein BC830DRAFT_86262 [Chytriomyces sp. MP71]
MVCYQTPKKTSQVNRYRDCMSWCRSQMKGHFLLYREVAPIKRSKRRGPSNTQSPKHRRFWETVLGPSPEHGRYICSVIRGKNKFVQGGLCKRTISLFGSNGIRYRVISYFYITDVERFYDDDAVFHVPCVAMDKPSSLPQFLPFLEKARLVQKSSVMGTTAAAHSPEE